MGNVHYALAQPGFDLSQAEQESHAQQYLEYMTLMHRTLLQAIKALPMAVYPYLRVAQVSAKLQQIQAAHAFLRRGLEHAEQQGDQVFPGRMRLMLGALTVLGGGSDRFRLEEVKALRQQGQQAAAVAKEWIQPLWWEHLEG